jgi:putative ABC transport system permease protein
MSVVWNKVFRDLAQNRNRTLIIVISTMIGVYALGLVFGLSDHLSDQITETHRSSSPSHIVFQGGMFTKGFVEAVSEQKYVTAVHGEKRNAIRWKFDGEEDWRQGLLISRDDYEAQVMNYLSLEAGKWPGKRNFAVERQTLNYYGVGMGQGILIEYGRSERPVEITGVVRMPTVFPPHFGGEAIFYTDSKTSSWLTGITDYNELHIQVEDFQDDKIEEVTFRVSRRLDRMRRMYSGYIVSDPEVHWMHETIDTLSLILVALGIMALLLSSFLIINTLNAIILQEYKQIGVMKVLGATSIKVFQVYLVMVLLYSAMIILIAVPLSIISVEVLSSWLLDMLNIEKGAFYVTRQAMRIQLWVGFLVPLCSAVVPILRGAMITPYQAITNYGLGGSFRISWFDRLMGSIQKLPRPLILSLRNTFRRKLRVILTMVALMIGGVLFIVVMSLNASMNKTMEVLLNDLGMDVWVLFERPYHVGYISDIAVNIPGVKHAEVWDQQVASLDLGGNQRREVYIMGLPDDSEIFAPRIAAGRNLVPEDDNAIVLNQKIAIDEGILVGDEVVLILRGKKTRWTVVGTVLNVSEGQSTCFVPLESLGVETASVNRGRIVMILAEEWTVTNEQALLQTLRDVYTLNGIPPAFVTSMNEVRQQSQAQFSVITILLLTMAILSAIVGSIGLMGTMSINVLERRREIGVMRAIGAKSSAIIGIFMGEGMFLGMLSWLLAVPISYPGARVFSSMIGQTLMNLPLNFEYSFSGMAIWFALVLVFSAAASFLPSMQATRISVRETLTYE